MRRCALILVLAFLTCELSGLDSFLLTERCTSVNDTLPDSCPPTCVRCGNCAQPIVSIAALVLTDAGEPQNLPTPMAVRAVTAPPHDILHVPRPLSLIA